MSKILNGGAGHGIVGRIKCFFTGHMFNINELKARDENGNVSWPCSRCRKVFKAHCGLSIVPEFGICFRGEEPSPERSLAEKEQKP